MVEEASRVPSRNTELALDLAVLATVVHPQTPTMEMPTRPKVSGPSETRTRSAKDSATEATTTIKTMATTKAMVSTRTKDLAASITRALTIKASISRASLTTIMAGTNNHMVKVRIHSQTTATNSKQTPMDRIGTTDTNSSHRTTDKDGTSLSRTTASRAGTATITNSHSRTMVKAGTPAISSNNHNSHMASRIGTNSSLRTTIGIKGTTRCSSRRSRIISGILANSVKLTSLRSMILLGARARPFLQKRMLANGTMSARSTILMATGASKAIAIKSTSLKEIPGTKAGTVMTR